MPNKKTQTSRLDKKARNIYLLPPKNASDHQRWTPLWGKRMGKNVFQKNHSKKQAGIAILIFD